MNAGPTDPARPAGDPVLQVPDALDLDGLSPVVAPLLETLRRRGWRLATAESCTGGLIAAAFTAVAGSSDVFDRGFVTYSNEAKTELLDVPAALIVADGAVSESVARSMALGALRRSRAHLAVAVTGVAGPGGGTPTKPVGLVWMGLAWRTGTAEAVRRGADSVGGEGREGAQDGGPFSVQAWRLQFAGTRAAVRSATVHEALRRIADAAF